MDELEHAERLKINLVYVDDQIDTTLEKYLYKHLPKQKDILDEGIHFAIDEIVFKPSKGYTSLIEDEKVQQSNIIIIDERLFENATANTGQFTGEEFKVILRKFFPFIEVIVITQNEVLDNTDIISKYCSKERVINFDKVNEYYDSNQLMPRRMIDCIKNIKRYRMLNEKLQNNPNIDDGIKDKVKNSLIGVDPYGGFTKADLDVVIDKFRHIEGLVRMSAQNGNN